MSKLKAMGDNSLDEIQEKMEFVCRVVVNIVEKEKKNAHNQHFLLVLKCFSKGFSVRIVKN